MPTPVTSRARRLLWALGLLLAAALGVALAVGAYRVPPTRLLRLLLAGGPAAGPGCVPDDVAAAVVWHLRMPRVLLAALVGGALAASGAVFQGCFRNPLAEPYILGVSSGAAFGAALAMVAPGFPFSVQAAAFLGALAAVGLVRGLARRRGETPVDSLLLAGVLVGALFAAGVSILKYLAADAALREILFWLLGGFTFASWDDATVAVPTVALSVMVMVTGGWTLNLLALGDHEAQALGIRPRRARRVLLGAATLATAACVSVAGIVPWIGLMAPHAIRMLVGADNRLVVPGAALLGALFLLICDTVARTVTTAEIPVGIVTALLGSPFLASLVRQRGPRFRE